MMNFSVHYRVNHILNSLFILTVVCVLHPSSTYFVCIGIWLTIGFLDFLLVYNKVQKLLFSRVSFDEFIVHTRTGKMIHMSNAQLSIDQLLCIYRVRITNYKLSKSFYFFSTPTFKIDFSPINYDGIKSLLTTRI